MAHGVADLSFLPSGGWVEPVPTALRASESWNTRPNSNREVSDSSDRKQDLSKSFVSKVALGRVEGLDCFAKGEDRFDLGLNQRVCPPTSFCSQHGGDHGVQQ